MALYIKPWQCHAVFFIVSDWLFREGGLHVTSHEPASGMQSSLQIPVTEMPNHSWWHAEIIASRVWMPSDSLVKCWVCFLIKTVYIVYIYIHLFLVTVFFYTLQCGFFIDTCGKREGSEPWRFVLDFLSSVCVCLRCVCTVNEENNKRNTHFSPKVTRLTSAPRRGGERFTLLVYYLLYEHNRLFLW